MSIDIYVQTLVSIIELIPNLVWTRFFPTTLSRVASPILLPTGMVGTQQQQQQQNLESTACHTGFGAHRRALLLIAAVVAITLSSSTRHFWTIGGAGGSSWSFVIMPEVSIASEVLSASLGGAISASVLFPLEVLKTKMQAETSFQNRANTIASTAAETTTTTSIIPDATATINETTTTTTATNLPMMTSNDDDDDEKDRSGLSMVEYARYLHRTQGFNVFFDGFQTCAFQSSFEKALYFFAFTGLKGIYRGLSGNDSVSTLASLVLGCLAEWAHLPFTLPVDCWTTAIVTNRDRQRGPIAVLFAMLSEKVRGQQKRSPLSVALLMLLLDKHTGRQRHVQGDSSLHRPVFQTCLAIHGV